MPPATTSRRITPALTVLMAVACGVAAANLYYAQPLLSTISTALHVGSASAGLIVTFSQIGYAVGLAFLVPIGDLVARRRLVPATLTLTAAALVASAAAPSIGVLVGLATLVGLGSVAAQILVPMAAALADDASRGRVVGTVMSGLLVGILLARTLSGLVASASSWRVVYVAGAVLVVSVAIVLAASLPADGERPRIGYWELLRSTATLFRTEPLLRRRSLLGALGFATFSIFWTTAAFLLSGPPYHYSEAVIGLFGLVGAAGALCATVAGRLADRGLTKVTTIGFAVLVAASFVPTYLGHRSVLALIVGVVVLDAGVNGLHVTNQSLIYRLSPEARSRINACYMVCYFVGGALGSALAGALWSADGWAGVCLAGGAVGVVATALALYYAARPARVGVAVG